MALMGIGRRRVVTVVAGTAIGTVAVYLIWRRRRLYLTHVESEFPKVPLEATASVKVDDAEESSMALPQLYRAPGIIHSKNEVWIDVHEIVNSNSELHAEGLVSLNVQLSGAPDLEIGIRRGSSVKPFHDAPDILKDICFHPSVDIERFRRAREIHIVKPPEGLFELMRYRVEIPKNSPPLLASLNGEYVLEHASKKLKFTVQAFISSTGTLRGEDVEVDKLVYEVWLPQMDCALHMSSARSSHGVVSFERGDSILRWRVRELSLESVQRLDLIAVFVAERPCQALEDWVTNPSGQLEYLIHQRVPSGITIRFLKVHEASNYVATKWIRYKTSARQLLHVMPKRILQLVVSDRTLAALSLDVVSLGGEHVASISASLGQEFSVARLWDAIAQKLGVSRRLLASSVVVLPDGRSLCDIEDEVRVGELLSEA